MDLKNIPTLKYSRVKVGITFGDPSGIGPEIIAKAIKRINGLAKFLIIGDRWVFEKAGASSLDNLAGVEFLDLGNVSRQNFKFGKINSGYGRASIEYLDKALELIGQKKIDCLVTGPISKAAINLAGYSYSGHTEYLAKANRVAQIGMMLLNHDLRFVLVTRHIPLREVPSALTKDKIVKASLLAYQSLRRLFLIPKPHIVICGLNPHASDSGLIGREESAIIFPAIKELRSKLKHVDGPMPADIAVAQAQSGQYHCVIAMYHDQALIPLKLLGRDVGVNLTLGLKFIRTSPLHGTAFDIAGTNCARPDSLIEAIKLALKCTINLKRV